MSPDADRRSDSQRALAALSEGRDPWEGAASIAPPRRLGPSRTPEGAPWVHHRHELAALVTAFVALLWLSVGLSLGSWAPSLVGCGFGAAALGIWSVAVWGAE